MLTSRVFVILISSVVTLLLFFLLVEERGLFSNTHIFSTPALDDNAIKNFRTFSETEQFKFLRSLGSREGPDSVRKFLKKTYPEEPLGKHELGHVIGETGFKKFGVATFKFCDAFMNYACFHGVILEALRKNGNSQDTLNNLARGCIKLQGNEVGARSCAHGIGHGVMWAFSYDLLSSYEACERMFVADTDRFFCYDGVSMENIVRKGEQGGVKNFLESKDPYYPCSSVPEKYQPACVKEHLHYAREVFYGKNSAESSGYCLHFKNQHTRSECFGALGVALAQDYWEQPERIVQECKKIDQNFLYLCIQVAARQYSINRMGIAVILCNSLGLDKKEECTEAVWQSNAGR